MRKDNISVVPFLSVSEVDVISSLEKKIFYNIAPGTLTGSYIHYDNEQPIKILIIFSEAPPAGSIARFYNNIHTLVSTLPLTQGVNRYDMYPPIMSDAIEISIDPR